MIEYYYYKFTKHYRNGEYSEVKKIFRENTHCGQYWNAKPTFNIFTSNVSIEMRENEKLVYNMNTGLGYRLDWDDDGCSITDDFEFKIGPNLNNNKLNIIRYAD